MKKYNYYIFVLISFFACQAKTNAQVSMNYGADSVRNTGESIDPVKRAETINLINSKSGLQINEHPLVYALSMIKRSQIKPDSLFNMEDSILYIIYLNDMQLPIMWIKIGMQYANNYRLTRIYGETGNQIIFEEIIGANYIYRNRIEYDEMGIPILSCIYENSGGKHGIKYLRENNKGGYIRDTMEDNCHCDW